MPTSTAVDIPAEEHAHMLAALRRARYGYLLALHIVLWCAAGRPPTAIAAVLFCSRSSVYRTVRAYRAGALGLEHAEQGQLAPPGRTTMLVPMLRRSLLALLKAAPRTYGWCRTRWSCATLAATLQAKRGIRVAAETMRRWVHEGGWGWKRATRVAKDDDPHRGERRARIRWVCEHLPLWEALVFADELDIQLLPKVGCAWRPKGTQVEVMTPGTNEKSYLAGALELATGTLHHAVGSHKTNELFRKLLQCLDDAYPTPPDKRLYVVVDNYKLHKATAVAQWLAKHPRFALLFLPTSCPRANPIERAFGDVHDCCTRDPQRTRLQDLVADVVEHVHANGPWKYKLCAIYHEPAVTEAVSKMGIEPNLATASSVYQSRVDRFRWTATLDAEPAGAGKDLIEQASPGGFEPPLPP
jgi:transposase